jgi:hypothetical protein
MAMQLVAQLSSLLSGWLSQGSISAGPNAGLSRTPIHARKQTSETVRILNGRFVLEINAHRGPPKLAIARTLAPDVGEINT